MGTVSRVEVVSQGEVAEDALPPRVQGALGELVGSAKEGLLALSVGVGLRMLTELLEEEVEGVVGPRGKHDPERIAVRHGHEPTMSRGRFVGCSVTDAISHWGYSSTIRRHSAQRRRFYGSVAVGRPES
jgi:hypothetical protein